MVRLFKNDEMDERRSDDDGLLAIEGSWRGIPDAIGHEIKVRGFPIYLDFQ